MYVFAALISWLTGKVFAAAVAVTLVIMKVVQLGAAREQLGGAEGAAGVAAAAALAGSIGHSRWQWGVRLRLEVCTSITNSAQAWPPIVSGLADWQLTIVLAQDMLIMCQVEEAQQE